MTKIENAIIDGFRVYVNIAQGRIDRMSELNEGQRSALFAFFEHMTGIRHVYDIRRSSSEMFLILSSMGFCTKRISDFMGVGEFNSGTYYRYVNLDLNQLAQSLAITELDESSVQDLQNCVKYFV